MNSQELQEKVQELKELQRLAEDLEAEMDAVRDQIKGELVAQGVEELKAGAYKVCWTEVKSTRFDTSAFRKAMPETAAQFTKTVKSRRFCVL